ncbi:MAG: 4Fe-4S dicluster domain-containing protein [Chitinophagaceae bacterium]|nr:MAG: 4Fe-4S dicluster domain-containing protein [Chitinophagaceae bacterium]
MENNKTQYWKGLDELNNEPSFEKQRHNEFVEKLPLNEVLTENEMNLSASRRDFLKFMGFSITAATLAACHKTPLKKAVPYVLKPEEIEPGIANYYASTCHGCQARCSLLVKTREGRPIKIEGNADSPFSRGGVCAVGQGTVLSLYDTGRLSHPLSGQKEISWKDLDSEIISKLNNIAGAGGNIRILTGTINSPSELNAIKEFTAKYPTAQHVMYDAVSSYALLETHRLAFGKFAVPNYKIEEAKAIVSFGADFLGTWISPVEYTKQYAAARRPEGKTSILHHVQFESTLSLSGSNADMRVVLKPSQYGQALVRLHNYIATLAGSAPVGNSSLELMGNSIKRTADVLWKNKGKSIVITDSNNLDHQALVAAINNMLGNYGSTIDMANASYQRAGNDKAMIALANDLKAGRVDAIIIGGDANPAYSYPDKNAFIEGLKKVKLSVSLADRLNETAEFVQYVAPVHHFLESWNDSMPKDGFYSIVQPTISPIFQTRGFQESLSTWVGAPTEAHEYMRNFWQSNVMPKIGGGNFEEFWAKTLHDGFVMTAPAAGSATGSVASLNIADAANRAGKGGNEDDVEVILYEKVAIRDGREANNPWLQELPDPVSKVSWDNYACVSPKYAEKHGLNDEDVIEIKANGYSVKLPVLRQPGQRNNTVAIAFGYGRTLNETAGKVLRQTGGGNAYPFATISGDTIIYEGQKVEVSGKTGTYPLALTQTHHHIEGRDLAREATIADFTKGHTGDPLEGKQGAHLISMWKDYRYPGHHWGMAIDLSACTGCNACVVSCNAENNVAVVGKDEVRRRREMHWLRIDRYYAIADTEGQYHDKYREIDELAEQKDNSKKGIDYENIKVVFQPMLCQQCNNAPCETVCPVAATTHSSEGINQMAYNRCVGTRYCANNCPYKVRRFNWFNYAMNDKFDYHMNNDLGRMVLNPDVTVRMRGVMEKCNFCVQRVQMGKLDAKKEQRALRDGDIKTACQQTCPANAIVFGDMNDPESNVSKLMGNKRSYTILTDLNTRPNISYMSKIRSVDTQVS